MHNPPLILASTSRYRRELLARLGLPFEVVSPHVDETPQRGETPSSLVLRLAEAKARAVAQGRAHGLVVGSDQVADCEGEPVGKPRDHDDAVRLLTRLSGRSVVFRTGVALVNAANGHAQCERVDVTSTLRRLSACEIEAYLVREQPYDCAGAVKSEALGIALFDSIQSDDPTALIGLPLITLARMLRHEGVDLFDVNR
ncbi:MAG TPA: Maf family nucleotide pyrophosphatase [Casimicrobiaceae bacterium]|nr:Maf family nucleotide pyrophosphatase [Casimicrobiaceae bacterium]